MSSPESMLSDDDKIVSEAKKRFKQCEDWESQPRSYFLDDIRFANGDAYNGYQWPDDIRNNRTVAEKPCLTINKTRQHNLQIINDARQNKPSVVVRPVGNGATYDSAQVFEGVIRHIEYISNAQAAYDTAVKFQVEGGIGYWRIVTDYADADSFDQEIFIKRIKDPLTVFIDPDIKQSDGSDARFAFIFDTMPREQFDEEYPEFKDKVGQSPLGSTAPDGWIAKDHVRIAEYYRRSPKKDVLLAFRDPETDEQITARISELPGNVAADLLNDPATRAREITEDAIEWFLIAGNVIIDRRPWPGKYIPIVRIVGEETVIDGKLDRKGHTRALIDPQRIYNYLSSAGVEFVATQTKTQWIAPARSIEGQETYWTDANIKNSAILPFNDVDDNGQPIAPPQRIEPPTYASGYLQGIQVAENEMMMVSGQYQAQFGAPGNETSAKAINERQRQGDNATYHFIDHQANGIRFTGKILIDLIPKIYDTPRTIRILAEDGTESHVMLDPQAQAAYVAAEQRHQQEVMAIFNPNVGKYDVEADIGPAYATQRQEAWNAFTQIVSQNPELVNIVGDLMFKSADFPGADEIAQRLERMVPPQAKGEGIPPAVQQMQGQVQHMQDLLKTTLQQLAEERLRSKSEAAQKEINVYKAVTDRMNVLLKQYVVTPKDQSQMLHDLMKEEHSASLSTTGNTENEILTNGKENGTPGT